MLDFHNSFRTITSIPLFPEKFEEQVDGMFFLIEDVYDPLAARSDASPASHQRHLSKQRRLYGERVEPGHVPLRLNAFDIKVIGLNDHASTIARLDSGVQ